MKTLLKFLPALALLGALSATATMGTGCDGKFVGPPGGSVTGSPGLEPLIGATPFTFNVENPIITGFYTDVWYIDPGRESDDGPGGVIGPWFADTVQALKAAGFSGWITNVGSPTHIEVNVQYPMMISFMAQWFRRNADGTRIRELDQFGSLVWSPKSLDISFVSAPVERIVLPSGQVIYYVNRQNYPAGSQGSVIFGWKAPAPTSPGDFPPPQQVFLGQNYNDIGLVMVSTLVPAGSPLLTQSLGIPVTDTTNNPNVENMGAVPRDLGGGWTAVAQPTGCFGDLYAKAYKNAPVLQPTTPGHTEDEAAIEYSRHLGALHSNLIAQAVGLGSVESGSIMDPSQVIWQNGFGYAFVLPDIQALDSIHLPGEDRDPTAP